MVSQWLPLNPSSKVLFSPLAHDPVLFYSPYFAHCRWSCLFIHLFICLSPSLKWKLHERRGLVCCIFGSNPRA